MRNFLQRRRCLVFITIFPGPDISLSLSPTSDWDVALIQAADLSNVPFAGDVTSFMEDLRPQVLVLVGIAGGLCDNGKGRDDITTGDVVIAEHTDYIEFLKLDGKAGPSASTYAIDHPSVPLRKNVCMPIAKMFKLRKNISPGKEPPAEAPCKIHIGPIVSGESPCDVNSEMQQEPWGRSIRRWRWIWSRLAWLGQSATGGTLSGITRDTLLSEGFRLGHRGRQQSAEGRLEILRRLRGRSRGTGVCSCFYCDHPMTAMSTEDTLLKTIADKAHGLAKSWPPEDRGLRYKPAGRAPMSELLSGSFSEVLDEGKIQTRS